ncbi:helix-turn-helix domain-containing protein [Pseudonocardia lacus]|uniref:helix-turn-helix domain-containing protein n=1 Tax=Pseudonocardia lacus TaxID=2835865 RepID=UPI001BDCE9C4|nr:helix-turn-helix transcriptional regulator [Pseudonocardia lacus]
MDDGLPHLAEEGASEAHLAREIRRAREAAGLSQAQLAVAVGYTREYVSRAEQASKGLVSANLVECIDQVLRADGMLVELHRQVKLERAKRRRPSGKHRADDKSSNPVGRDSSVAAPDPRQAQLGATRTGLAGSGRPSASRAAQPSVVDKSMQAGREGSANIREGSSPRSSEFAELFGVELSNLAAAMSPTGVSAAMLDAAERTVSTIHARFAAASPAELLPVVNDHLRVVTRLLGVAQPIAYRRRLCSVAGHLAGQRAWLMADLVGPDEADAWYEMAVQPAEEAEDGALLGWLRGAQSVVAFDRDDPVKALQLIRQGRHHVRHSDESPVTGWLHALEARAHARLGAASQSHAALDRARSRNWLVSDDSYRHGMDAQRGELSVDYYEGCSLLELGEGAAARRSFAIASNVLAPDRRKAHVVIQLHAAMTVVGEDPRHAVDSAVAAASELPEGYRIRPIVDRLQKIRRMAAASIPGSALAQIDQFVATGPAEPTSGNPA